MSVLDFDPKIHFITDLETGKRTTIYEFWDHYLSYKEGRKEPKRFEKRAIPEVLPANTNQCFH